MGAEVFVAREKRIYDPSDLLRVLAVPMAEAVKGTELARFRRQIENLRHYAQGRLVDLRLNLS
jgi:hypothetical protein